MAALSHHLDQIVEDRTIKAVVLRSAAIISAQAIT